MIVFEMTMLITFAVITVVTIAAMGRPIAEAYAEKLKARYRSLDSDAEMQLTTRISTLEQEVTDLRKQVSQIQDATDFAVKLLEKKDADVPRIQDKQSGGV